MARWKFLPRKKGDGKVLSIGEEKLLMQLKAKKLPLPQREYRFHPTRKWRSDFYWPEYNLLCEIEGRGRHQSFIGFRNDCEKYNAASMMGFCLVRFSTEMVTSGMAFNTIEQYIREYEVSTDTET